MKEAYYKRGLARYILGSLDEALKDLSRAVSIDRDYIEVYKSRGEMLFKAGRFDEAIVEYTKLITHSGNDPAYFVLRGNTYTTMGLLDKAKKDYETACEMGLNLGCVKVFLREIPEEVEKKSQEIKYRKGIGR